MINNNTILLATILSEVVLIIMDICESESMDRANMERINNYVERNRRSAEESRKLYVEQEAESMTKLVRSAMKQSISYEISELPK